MILKILLFIFIAFVPFTISSRWFREIEDSECTESGRMCRTCDQVSFCIEITEGNWLQQDIIKCEPGTTCLPSLKNCTTESNPYCDIPASDYKFVCRRPGIFPDPLNCFEYHICKNIAGSRVVDPDSILKKCPKGFYYDSLTTKCSLKSVNETCPSVTPTCMVIGQAGALARNPSLYYVCLKSPEKTFPQIFSCLEGKVYNATVARCTEKPHPPTAQGPDGKCSAKGYFYDPNDCHGYYECGTVGGIPVARRCATKLYFNATLSSCVDFKCSDLH